MPPIPNVSVLRERRPAPYPHQQGFWRPTWEQLKSLQPAGRWMAGHCLAKALAFLSVALASAALRPSSGPISAGWSPFSSQGFPPNFIMSVSNSTAEKPHKKARTSPYPAPGLPSGAKPGSQWEGELAGWVARGQACPVHFWFSLGRPKWADPLLGERNFSPKFNEKDGPVERRSQNSWYEVEHGRPRNPAGRTGLVGRGLWRRWGPSHAADPILTRWKKDSKGNEVTHPVSGRNILQFVAIKRKDCGEWAIPGGMVDQGEKFSATPKREFGEEARNSLQKSRADTQELEK